MEFYQQIVMSLKKIDTIVENYRNQKQGFAEKELKEFIPDLSLLIAEIQKRKMDCWQEELVGLLSELLMSQESLDYVCLTDLLDKELRRYLENLLVELREKEEILLLDFWDKNMGILKQRNPILEKHLNTVVESDVYYHLLPADNGELTLAVEEEGKIRYLHSRLNPYAEGKKFALAYESLEAGTYIVYGFGMGYHIENMVNCFLGKKIIVLESDLELLQIALRYRDFSEILCNDNLEIHYGKERELLVEYLPKEIEQVGFLLHVPSLSRVKDKKMKELLEDYYLRTNAMLAYGQQLQENFRENSKKKYPVVDELRWKFQDKTMVLVAAGPSLDDDIEVLKSLPKDILVVAVGTVAKRLQKEQIPMDYIIISDPTCAMKEQVEGINGENIPLLLLSTASSEAGNIYQGEVFLMYQKGFQPAEEMAAKEGALTFETGGSVSTLALDMGIRFGVSKIICVGLDLAYTKNRHHAGQVENSVMDDTRFRKVEGIGEKWVYTIRNLDTYRKWIERRIASEKEIKLINTAKGARIHGMLEMSLEQVLLEYDNEF